MEQFSPERFQYLQWYWDFCSGSFCPSLFQLDSFFPFSPVFSQSIFRLSPQHFIHGTLLIRCVRQWGEYYFLSLLWFNFSKDFFSSVSSLPLSIRSLIVHFLWIFSEAARWLDNLACPLSVLPEPKSPSGISQCPGSPCWRLFAFSLNTTQKCLTRSWCSWSVSKYL